MPDNFTVHVDGLRELERAFRQAGNGVAPAFRKQLKEVAAPVKLTAETYAATRIARNTPRWSRMRVGMSKSVLYMVPREKGRRGRGDPKFRRSQFGQMLLDRAMIPAVQENRSLLEQGVERTLDHVDEIWKSV